MAESWQDSVNEYLNAEDDGVMVLSEDVKKVWVVRSKSDERAFYYVLDLGWMRVCTCDGFRFRTDCSHVRKVDGEG